MNVGRIGFPQRTDAMAAIEPLWYARLHQTEQRLRDAEKVILALRRKLIEADPSLPNEYDGTAWAQIEQANL